MVDKRSGGNYNDNKGNRKRGEKMDVDKRNEELDETIIQTCKWIQKKLQISDKSIRDEKVPEMMSALAELVAARAGETITHPRQV